MSHLSNLLDITGVYFYLLFLISSLMWGYIFYIHSKLKCLSRYELSSLYIQTFFLKRLKTVFFLAGTAPIVGLLGTVDGIIDIFKNIGVTSNVSASIMASGIGKSLITTQAGLVIAIPGLVVGNFIKEKYTYPEHLLKKGGKKMRRRKDKNIANELNMTPLLDMVFILLIFFVVTSSFIQNQILEISIPSASSGKNVDEKIHVISIDKGEKLYFDKKLLSKSEIEDLIEKRSGSIKKIIVSPDKELGSGKLVEVIDFLYKKNIKDIAILVKENE